METEARLRHSSLVFRPACNLATAVSNARRTYTRTISWRYSLDPRSTLERGWASWLAACAARSMVGELMGVPHKTASAWRAR
jgi:hypothetical protein